MVRGVALVLGLATLAPGSIHAQDAGASPEARAHFEAGTEAFDVGEYERAAAEFRAAYDLTHHPDLLFNIYSALERAGELEQAADALDAYLREGDPDDERRTALAARLARLRERLAEARADRAEAELRAQRDAPAEAPVEPPDPSPTPPPSDGGVHPAGVGLLIGGGVLLVSFAVFAGLAAAEDGRLTDTCSPGCPDDEVATLGAFNLVADISWITGAVVAATGLVLVFALPPEGDEATAALAPWVAPGGGGLVAAGRFR